LAGNRTMPASPCSSPSPDFDASTRMKSDAATPPNHTHTRS
jgi:hypothetical protein